MKKLVVIALVFALACTFVFANGGTEAKADTIESKIANGQKLSDAELLELAKAETGSWLTLSETRR